MLFSKFIKKLKYSIIKYSKQLVKYTIFCVLLLLITIYTILYTTFPAYLVVYYFKFNSGLKINQNAISGYLLNPTGLEIESIDVSSSFTDIKISKINIKLNLDFNKIKDYTTTVKISDISLIKDGNNSYKFNNITANIDHNNYKIYLGNNLIAWNHKNNATNEFNNRFELNLNKPINITPNLPSLDKVKIRADFNSRKLIWDVTAVANNQNLIISGYSDLSSYLPTNTYLNIKTKDIIQLHSSIEAELYGIPNIDINISQDKYNKFKKKTVIDIGGDINITYGLIQPFNQNKIKLSDDVVFIDSEQQENNDLYTDKIIGSEKFVDNRSTSLLDINTNIKLHIDNVTFKTPQLSTKLKGELNIFYNHNNNKSNISPLAQGEINLIDGVYQIYGYPLKIAQGVLLYSNNPIDNPTIKLNGARDIEIQYKNRNQINNSSPETKVAKLKNAKVGINISGSLNKPNIKLYSSVMMTEADKISYLLFGVPSYKMSEAHGQIIIQTARQLFGNTKEYSKISKQMSKYINVDEFNIVNKPVTNPETGNLENQTNIILSKRILGNLLLKYGFNLANPISTFTAEYEIRKNLSLTAQYDSQSASSADIIYYKETDKLL